MTFRALAIAPRLSHTLRSVLTPVLLCMSLLLAACGGGADSTTAGAPVAQAAPGNYTLNVTTSGSGTVTSSPSGISCGTSCSTSYTSGSSVTLTASAATGYSFSGWGGACSGTSATCTISMTAARTVSATFSQTGASSYTLTVSNIGSGTVSSSPAGINCGTTCSASYATGASVTLTATAATGYSFSGWSGACSGTSATCAVSMSTARNVTATFTQNAPTTYTLSVTTSGSGSVTSSPSGINCGTTCSSSYASGTSVTLTASAATGYSFSGWGGSCSGTSTSCTVSMTAARSATASFTQNAPTTYTLSVSTSGSGNVTSSPSGINCGTSCSASYTSGTSVTLTATASAGYSFSGWGGACSGLSSTCTLAMSANLTATAIFATTGTSTGSPVLFFSDLDSGPNTGGENNQGVFVTVWGKNFGATQGSGTVTVGGGAVARYLLWSDGKIIFQLGAATTSGNIVVTSAASQSSNGLPFTVRAGAIYYVAVNGTGNGDVGSPMSPSAAYNQMGPGKTFYFRGGTYNQNYSGGGLYGYRNYSLDQAHGGTAGSPMAMVGYPNETAVFQYLDISRSNIGMNNGGSPASYVTFANFTLIGGSACFEDGGFYTNPNSGGVGIRLIGNVMSAAYGSANTMTGVILIQNNYWKVLGNEMKDTGTGTPINNNHGIYNQAGSSYTEIAWNYFHDLRMGGVVQIHTDPYYSYYGVSVHDNVFAKGANGDSRAIVIGNANGDSYGYIYNNVFDSIGSGYGAIGVWSGTWKVYNNTMYNIQASGSQMVWVTNAAYTSFGAPSSWLPGPNLDIKNNIFYSDGSTPYFSTSTSSPAPVITMDHNLYYNAGAPPLLDAAAVNANPLFVNAAAGNFHLQSSSPAINVGSSGVGTVTTMDHDGVRRPQGGGYDIGVYEQ